MKKALQNPTLLQALEEIRKKRREDTDNKKKQMRLRILEQTIKEQIPK